MKILRKIKPIAMAILGLSTGWLVASGAYIPASICFIAGLICVFAGE